MISAALILTGLAVALGIALTIAAVRLRASPSSPVIEKVNALLPQTQCGQCNFAGCRPYAEAIVSGEAAINQCPPGGVATIEKLAQLLGQEIVPLNDEHGIEKESEVAFIHEDLCIGCKKCILVCPVDAIVGATKKMHTVIAAECTGCELCLEPCPVDCIDMIQAVPTIVTWRHPRPGTVSDES